MNLQKFASIIFFLSPLFGCVSTHWEFVGRMSQPRSAHTATLLNDGRVLVAGGFNSDGVLASAEIYDPTTKLWIPTGAMHVPRARHIALRLPDGTVLVTGGATNLNHPTSGTETAEKYDPSSGTWSFVQAMLTKRIFHTATLMTDGSVLVVAGGPSGSHDAQLSAERYFPSDNKWVGIASSRAAHNRGTATLMPNGDVLVSGGVEYGPEQDNPTELLINYSERYDRNANRWYELAVMQETPFAHTATLLDGGKVLVTGGRALQTYNYAVVYDPRQENGQDFPPVWSNTKSLTYARSNHQATKLPNGDVLVTGGFLNCVDHTNPPGGCASSLSSVELFHPDANTYLGGDWTSQENMFEYRGDHTATLLQNGTVLVVGGYNWFAQSARDSAEVFWPQGRPK
jgi:N-acetylneuraminic acid mutarotase